MENNNEDSKTNDTSLLNISLNSFEKPINKDVNSVNEMYCIYLF